MRENSRLKSRRELSIEPRQAFGLLAVALLATGGAFLLGTSIGRASARATAASTPAPRDPLARLDQPIGAASEPAPTLQAPQALVDHRSLDKAIPVAMKPAFPAEKSDADEVLTPPAVDSSSAAPAPSRPAAAARPAASAPAAGDLGTAPAPVATAQAPAAPTPPASSSIAAAASASHSAAPAAARPAAGKLPRVAAANEARRSAAERKHGRYTIQVGAAPRRTDAERLARRLAPRPAQIVAADLPGKGRWYRVQLGSYDSEASARQGLNALARAGVHGMITAVR